MDHSMDSASLQWSSREDDDGLVMEIKGSHQNLRAF